MSQTPQRRPYISRTASFASGTDSPLQVLEECLAEIDRREAAVGAFTLIDAAAARSAAKAAAEGLLFSATRPRPPTCGVNASLARSSAQIAQFALPGQRMGDDCIEIGIARLPTERLLEPRRVRDQDAEARHMTERIPSSPSWES